MILHDYKTTCIKSVDSITSLAYIQASTSIRTGRDGSVDLRDGNDTCASDKVTSWISHGLLLSALDALQDLYTTYVLAWCNNQDCQTLRSTLECAPGPSCSAVLLACVGRLNITHQQSGRPKALTSAGDRHDSSSVHAGGCSRLLRVRS